MNEAKDPPAGAPAALVPGGRDVKQDELFARLYADLKQLARREARRYGPATPLGPTTLLHEAYLQLAGREALEFVDTGRFLAYASRAMRGLVIDRLRAQSAGKRGGGLDITSFDTGTAEMVGDPCALDEISAALDELAVLQPELARVVDLKFFCGFTMTEIAAQCGSSERSVQRQWEKARALLYRALRTP